MIQRVIWTTPTRKLENCFAPPLTCASVSFPCPGPWSPCIQLAFHSCKTFTNVLQSCCTPASCCHSFELWSEMPSGVSFQCSICCSCCGNLLGKSFLEMQEIRSYIICFSFIETLQYSQINLVKKIQHELSTSLLGSFGYLMNLKNWWSLEEKIYMVNNFRYLSFETWGVSLKISGFFGFTTTPIWCILWFLRDRKHNHQFLHQNIFSIKHAYLNTPSMQKWVCKPWNLLL